MLPAPLVRFAVPFAVATVLASCSSERQTFVSLYDSQDGPVKGWSHVAAQPERFPLISLDPPKYAVDERSMTEDEAIAGKKVFRTVLVRKLSNWGQQHANGIEPVFFDRPLPIDAVESVTLRLKLNSSDSSIPQLAALKLHYQGQLGDETVESLDTGVPCLGLTFAEAGYNDQSTETLNATYSLSFDPKRDFDRWMEITIPLADFSFGYERNYVMKPASREALPPSEWIAFRINPETTSGKVARNYIGDAWDDSVPEIYKELSISLESIGANMKAGGSH